MKPSDFVDQVKIFDPKQWSWPVHVIGAGGINNMLGMVLAKMGITEIHVWDDDVLESRNLPTEVAYGESTCGQPKTVAFADSIYHLMVNGVEVYQHQERVTADTELSGVVISGVDSMSGRQEIWEAVKGNYLEIPFFIDARSGGEETQIFAFSPADFELREDYETWLFDDSEAARLECGARNIAYIAAYFAGEIGRLITKFFRDEPIKEFPIKHNFANE